MFKTARQKKYRRFLEAETLDCDNMPTKYKGKLLVAYDNCKEMICEPELEVKVTENCYLPIKGYGKSYSTGLDKIQVEISGTKTNIARFLKDGNSLIYVFCIQNLEGCYIDLDVRTIEDFPEIHWEKMVKEGLQILEAHIKENQSAYTKFIQ